MEATRRYPAKKEGGMADEDVCHKAARNTHEADMGHLGVSPCSTRPSGNEEARNNAAQPIDGRLAGEFAEDAHGAKMARRQGGITRCGGKDEHGGMEKERACFVWTRGQHLNPAPA